MAKENQVNVREIFGTFIGYKTLLTLATQPLQVSLISHQVYPRFSFLEIQRKIVTGKNGEFRPQSYFNGLTGALARVVYREGLVKGPLTITAPLLAERSLRHLYNSSDIDIMTKALVSAAILAPIDTALCAPLENYKTYSAHYRIAGKDNFWNALLNEDGIGNKLKNRLYKGALVMNSKTFLTMGTFFASHELVRSAELPMIDKSQRKFAEPIITGVISAVPVVTLDVVKTQLQTGHSSKSALGTLKDIYREGGFTKTLTRGLGHKVVLTTLGYAVKSLIVDKLTAHVDRPTSSQVKADQRKCT